MCFSPDADAVVGGIVVVIGLDALRHVREPKQIVLASLPLLFGLHQIDEAFVWWGLQGRISESIGRVGTWVYLLFALAALPALVPLAVLAIERSSARRRVIAAFSALGIGVGAALGISMFRGPVNAAIDGRHIAYDVSALHQGGQVTALYVLAACGALVLCSYRDIAALGLLNLVAVPVLMWLTVSGFISLWCFWAAIVSVVIDHHLRRRANTLPRRMQRSRARDVANVT
ncbi:MAG: hypothetical protein QOG65_1955 [Actinomycetota bacterium]|jgi:hypothetical protein|nr:hypothetical protein [Actinomycetota bacterium]